MAESAGCRSGQAAPRLAAAAGQRDIGAGSGRCGCVGVPPGNARVDRQASAVAPAANGLKPQTCELSLLSIMRAIGTGQTFWSTQCSSDASYRWLGGPAYADESALDHVDISAQHRAVLRVAD